MALTAHAKAASASMYEVSGVVIPAGTTNVTDATCQFQRANFVNEGASQVTVQIFDKQSTPRALTVQYTIDPGSPFEYIGDWRVEGGFDIVASGNVTAWIVYGR